MLNQQTLFLLLLHSLLSKQGACVSCGPSCCAFLIANSSSGIAHKNHHRRSLPLHRNSKEWTIKRCRLLQSTQQMDSGNLRPDPLIPEENLKANRDVISKGGVLYKDVWRALQALYPPETFDERNALSRKDGYWPYLRQGDKEVPKQYTYGEYDFFFFAQLLDLALEHLVVEKHQEVDDRNDDNNDGDVPSSPKLDEGEVVHEDRRYHDDKVFLDLGSGTGRLVFGAAALQPQLRQCRGIEILPGICQAANDMLASCSTSPTSTVSPSSAGGRHFLPLEAGEKKDGLSMSPIEFVCDSFLNPYVYMGDADIIFCFSSCCSGKMMDEISHAIARQCRPGTIIITTDYQLVLNGKFKDLPGIRDDRIPQSGIFELELVDKLDGYCWLTGGISTAYIHRIIKSAWTPDSKPLEPPMKTLEDKAWEVAMALEAGELGDPERFLRDVNNNIIFNGLPEKFLVKRQT